MKKKGILLGLLSTIFIAGCSFTHAQEAEVPAVALANNTIETRIADDVEDAKKRDIGEVVKEIRHDKKQASKVVKLIDELPEEIATSHKEQIENTSKEYEDLTDKQKVRVTNTEDLENAKEKLRLEEEREEQERLEEEKRKEAEKLKEEKKEEETATQPVKQTQATQDLTTKEYTQPFSTFNNQEVTVGDYVTSGDGLHVENLRGTGTNGCSVYYSKITGKEPQITMGSAFSVPAMANSVGATVAINAGMGYSNGGVYYAYGDLYHGYSGHQSGDTLVLRNNGWLDDCWIDSNNVTTLGLKWAVKGLNCYTYNGQHTGYADCGVHPYSFIAQDYSGAYYIGAFSSASFSTMHASLKKLIPNIKLMYATEGGGMVKYVENGNLIFNGRGQDYRYSNAMIWF